MTDETPDVVSRARAALDGITPGEWVAHHFHHQKTGEWVGSDVTPVAEACGNGDGGICTSEDDAKFIAASPRLVRELLAENERLRDDLRVERTVTHMCESVDADLREARTEVEQLTAERDQVIAAHQRAESRATLHREERDEAHAAVDRVRKLVTDTQTVGWAGIPVMHGGKPFPVMVSVDAVIDALDRKADRD